MACMLHVSFGLSLWYLLIFKYFTVPGGNNQRPEYTSQMQVAAATGQPILAPAPMNTQPQAITAVQIPQNMLPQTPAHYQV